MNAESADVPYESPKDWGAAIEQPPERVILTAPAEAVAGNMMRRVMSRAEAEALYYALGEALYGTDVRVGKGCACRR